MNSYPMQCLPLMANWCLLKGCLCLGPIEPSSYIKRPLLLLLFLHPSSPHHWSACSTHEYPPIWHQNPITPGLAISGRQEYFCFESLPVYISLTSLSFLLHSGQAPSFTSHSYFPSRLLPHSSFILLSLFAYTMSYWSIPMVRPERNFNVPYTILMKLTITWHL